MQTVTRRFDVALHAAIVAGLAVSAGLAALALIMINH